MRYLQLLIILLAFIKTGTGQSTEIGINYLLSSEKLTSTEAPDIYEDKVFYSFGITGKRFLSPNIFIGTGIGFRRFGARIERPVTTAEYPNGTGEFYYLNWIAKGIEIPINIGYYFLNQDNIRLGASASAGNFFLLDQKYVVNDNSTDLNQYKSYIFSTRINLELRVKLSDKISLNFIPFYQKQISPNMEFQLNGINIDYKQRSVGCELAVSYKL